MPIGLLLYDLRDDQFEVVVLIAIEEGRGIATALLEAARSVANAARCRRMWLITTNDNTAAIDFYQRRGWTKVATYHGAVARSRRSKPELPEVGRDGIPIRDEIEFELRLQPGGT